MAAALVALAACRSADYPPESGNFIIGTVTYRESITLPPDAVLEVQLLHVAPRDAPVEVLSTVTISPITQVPLFFKLGYDPGQILPDQTYALRARITSGSRLRFINTRAARVLTFGYPAERNLVLDMVTDH